MSLACGGHVTSKTTVLETHLECRPIRFSSQFRTKFFRVLAYYFFARRGFGILNRSDMFISSVFENVTQMSGIYFSNGRVEGNFEVASTVIVKKVKHVAIFKKLYYFAPFIDALPRKKSICF